MADLETRKGPGQYEDEAVRAERSGDFAKAAELYDAANGVTLGHSRADRYYHAAAMCRAKAKGLLRTCSVCGATPDGLCTPIASDTYWEQHYMHDARWMREAPATK